MRADLLKIRVYARRMLTAAMAAACFCTVGCAKKTQDDTLVTIDISEINNGLEYADKYGEEGTYIAISGFATPEPIVTPKPTPEPTPKPTKKPKATKEPKKEEKKDDKKDDDKKEENKSEPSATSKPKTVGKTPYAGKYQRASVKFADDAEGIKFETTTIDGETVTESLFARNGITMVNIWTQT